MHKRLSESGAVSLFLVIFAMLLISVVTISFLRVMVHDQDVSSQNDLSKSALDSANAGTEDAKRELIYLRTVCGNGQTAKCNQAIASINENKCNTGLSDVVPQAAGGGEVAVQQSVQDAQELNQAYTCVKIQLDTPTYDGTLQANTSKVIPLTSTTPFSSVTLSWYTQDDLGSTSKTVSIDSNWPQKKLYLPGTTTWPANRPSLMRTQLIQFGSSFTLASFDASSTDNKNSNANTLFLYPGGTAASSSLNFTDDVRKTPPVSPQAVLCKSSLSSGGYACSVTITMPAAIGQDAANDATKNVRTAYLRLTALYNATHFSVKLNAAEAGQTALFDMVQPSIDSTGRANEQYRRTESKVDLVPTGFAYPEAAVDVTGDFCKTFTVTNAATDYDPGDCSP